MENTDHNNILLDEEDYEFHYNFINIPWGDRSKRSKFEIVFLLSAIFCAIALLVLNNFRMHFSPSNTTRIYHRISDYNCQLVKVEDYKYIARIHLVDTQELMCIGAVISYNLVLANTACVKNGEVRIYVNGINNPRCKKGFAVSGVDQAPSDSDSNELVLLSTYEDMYSCVTPISIGSYLRSSPLAYVIGRPTKDERLLSRHPVIKEDMNCSCPDQPRSKKPNTDRNVCVKSLVECPMLIGDLLVQDEQLYGLASTSIYNIKRFSIACYTDVTHLRNEIMKIVAYF